jgi:uncharacterized protein (DUF3820 family)
MATLTRRGIRLQANGGRLRYYPPWAVTPDLLDRLKAHKIELLTLLRPISARYVDTDTVADDLDANEFYWSQISESDRDYLIGPRKHVGPCAWCGGRLIHHPLCEELQRSWEPTIPFGKHAGKRVSAVPHDYLAWLVRQTSINRELREAVQLWLKSEATR